MKLLVENVSGGPASSDVQADGHKDDKNRSSELKRVKSSAKAGPAH